MVVVVVQSCIEASAAYEVSLPLAEKWDFDFWGVFHLPFPSLEIRRPPAACTLLYSEMLGNHQHQHLTMENFKSNTLTHKNGEITNYYEGGSPDGIPLVFLHGWPDIAESWIHQLTYFSSTGKYRVTAPDMRGYGDSTAPKTKRSYSLEVLVQELIELAAHLNIKKAVWVAHDWGCGPNAALAAHHPELYLGLASLAVPYRTAELGLNHIKTLINRDLYPEDEYEWGQWDYMRYYELHPEESIKSFEANIDRITPALYVKADPRTHGQRSRNSRVQRDGGMFGGHPENIPEIPLAKTSLTEHHLANLLKSHKKHGFFPPTAWYLNHDVNEEYSKSEKNGGVLEFPVLFIDAKYDSVCSPSVSPKLAEPQKEACKDLTYETVEAAHWLQLEKPDDVNRVLEKWLNEKIQSPLGLNSRI
ncbi:alpha/beta-hydrolase [Plenodomus tracheiphilus IPT5]|uniref:Alpha/beta-hydrolase n=1 Tax=Plenodomus tracheiphilus IPT5 TaxID=1408161 RepID=A0A6A7AZ93_9PLEO|nr:alpha/beta-hydrolase [Plenodomus tracheiphilus IPT5]